MTTQYERLRERPQTGVEISRLNFDERRELRKIQVRQTSDQSNPPRAFTTIYYLEGKERAAAKVFVEENRDALERIDFSLRDPIQQAVPRDVYDWILHFLGERKLRKYESVVHERRHDSTHWLIDRQVFETHPTRRYTTSEGDATRVIDSPESVYDDLGPLITERDLRDHGAVAGAVEYLLEYYRVAGPFACIPETIDGELAVRKQS